MNGNETTPAAGSIEEFLRNVADGNHPGRDTTDFIAAAPDEIEELVEPMAKVASPGYDSVSKFASAPKEFHGAAGPSLSRTLSRFVKNVRDQVNEAILSVNASIGLQLAPAVQGAVMNVSSGGGGEPLRHYAFNTSSEASSARTKTAVFGASGHEQSVWQRMDANWKEGMELMPHLGTALKGMALGMVGFGLSKYLGADTGARVFGLLGAASAGLMLYGLSQASTRLDADNAAQKAAEEAAANGPLRLPAEYPIDIRLSPLGRYDGAKPEFKAPSEEFLEIAKRAMTEEIGNREIAERQIAHTLQTFASSLAAGHMVEVKSLGIKFDAVQNCHTISIKDPEADNGYKQICAESEGELFVNEVEFFRLRDMEIDPEHAPVYR